MRWSAPTNAPTRRMTACSTSACVRPASSAGRRARQESRSRRTSSSSPCRKRRSSPAIARACGVVLSKGTRRRHGWPGCFSASSAGRIRAFASAICARWVSSPRGSAAISPLATGSPSRRTCRARRLAQAFERIRHGGSVDDAVFETGYESHSGFREAFQKTFGLTPRQTAEGDCIRLAWLDTPMGPMVAGATDGGICLLEFTDRRMLEKQLVMLRRRYKAGLVPGRHAHLTTLRRELGEYFAGKRQVFDVPVDMRGTPFQMSVWRALREIPLWGDEVLRGHGAPPRQPRSCSRRGHRQRSQRDRHRCSLPPRGEQERRSRWLRRGPLAQAAPAAPRSRVYALTALFRRRASRFSRAPLLGSRPRENVAEAVVAFVTCVLEEWANRLGPRHLC